MVAGCLCKGCCPTEGDVAHMLINGIPTRSIYKNGAWHEFPPRSDPYERGRQHARRRNKTW